MNVIDLEAWRRARRATEDNESDTAGVLIRVDRQEVVMSRAALARLVCQPQRPRRQESEAMRRSKPSSMETFGS